MTIEHGYSLVELAVAIAVMTVVSLLAVPAFQTAMGNAQIRTVAESIHNGLQQARTEAIKRNTKMSFILSTNSAWQFGCVTVTSTCPSVIASKSASEGSSSNITISADASAVTFSSFGTKDVSSGNGLSQVDITDNYITASDLKALRVILSAGGYARVCDPSVAVAGDPRAC